MKSSLFQIILLSTFGALAVTGVLIFAIATSGGETNEVGPIKIWGTLDQTAFSVVLRQAAEANPSLALVTYEEKDEATFDQDLTAALASGTGPDLYLMRQDYAYAHSPLLVAIPYDSLSESQFRAAFIDAATPYLAGSGILAVPLVVDPLVLYWNRDILGTAGYAKQPQYWDELYPMAQAITKRDDTGRIERSAIAFGEYDNIANAKEILSLLILQAGGSLTARDNANRLVSALSPKAGDTTQATLSALRFYTEFADPSKGDYSWNRSLPEARQAFAAGDVALYVGFASEEPVIERLNPNLNFAVSPVPQIRNRPNAVDTGRVWGFAVPRTSRNPAAAVTVAFTLSSADIGKSLSVALGMPSARRDVLSLPAEGNDDLYNKQAIIQRSWIDPDPEKTSAIFQVMIEDTVSGSALITEAVTRADQEMTQLLGL